MALLTDRQQRNLLIALGLTDFATRSRLSTAAFDVVVATARRFGPTVARTAPRLAATTFQVGKQIAIKHPVLTAGAVVYYAYQNRDEIGALVEQGYEVVQDIQTSGAFSPTRIMQAREQAIQESPERFATIPFTKIKVRKKPTSFNLAVKAGMGAVKKSTSYGGKGKIKPAKKAFALVVKLASAKMKKKKAPKSGIRRRIWNAMKGLR